MADKKRDWDNLTVDLSNIKTVEELHAELKAAFEFPDYYGGNLDA
ncbi:MAG: barstar family protein, partial [Clostridia bacterium]|nr:barstar family protein [Clostridia bacterium]